MEIYEYYKKHKGDKVFWVSHYDVRGELLISFDGKTMFNLWQDYPDNLTKEQKELFDMENPFWKEYFKDRCLEGESNDKAGSIRDEK